MSSYFDHFSAIIALLEADSFSKQLNDHATAMSVMSAKTLSIDQASSLTASLVKIANRHIFSPDGANKKVMFMYEQLVKLVEPVLMPFSQKMWDNGSRNALVLHCMCMNMLKDDDGDGLGGGLAQCQQCVAAGGALRCRQWPHCAHHPCLDSGGIFYLCRICRTGSWQIVATEK
jgi:hypothetical protein